MKLPPYIDGEIGPPSYKGYRMDIVNRSLVRSVASSVVKIERKNGKTYNTSSLVDVWNTEYELVNESDLPNFQKLVEKEVEAERCAKDMSFSVSKVGSLRLKADSVTGTLSTSLKMPDGVEPI